MSGEGSASRRGPVAHAALCVFIGIAALEAILVLLMFGVGLVSDPGGFRGGIFVNFLLLVPLVGGLGAVTWGAGRAYRGRDATPAVRLRGWLAVSVGGVLATVPLVVMLASVSFRGAQGAWLFVLHPLAYSVVAVAVFYDSVAAKARLFRRIAYSVAGLAAAVLALAVVLWVRGSMDTAPVDDSDLRLTLEPLADEANALHWLRLAADRLTAMQAAAGDDDPVKDVETWVDLLRAADDPDRVPWDDARVTAALERTAPLASDLTRAAACERAQPRALTSAPGDPEIPFFAVLTAGRRLAIEAEVHRRHGRYGRALESAGQLTRVGTLLRAGPGTYMQRAVGEGLLREAADRLARLASDPACLPEDLARAADLLEAAGSGRNGFQAAVRVDYTWARDALAPLARQFADPGDLRPLPAFLWHPNETLGYFAERARRTLSAAEDVPSGKVLEVVRPARGAWARFWFFVGGNASGKLAYLSSSFPFDPWHESDTRVGLTRLQLLATAFRRRQGRLPATLDELAAASAGSALPTDPYSGKPFRYDPARGLVWSVGPDGADSDGAPGSDDWTVKVTE